MCGKTRYAEVASFLAKAGLTEHLEVAWFLGKAGLTFDEADMRECGLDPGQAALVRGTLQELAAVAAEARPCRAVVKDEGADVFV